MISVAIDGPAGAGKSTVCKALSQQLGFIHVDTGALYRAIGVYALQNHVNPRDWAAVDDLLPQITIRLSFTDDKTQRIYLNGEDVTDIIRRPEVSMAASDVSANPRVREFLLELQRSLARENNVIMDGRDIGTVVLPDADIKIFLTASAETRALRRFLELREKNHEVDYQQVLDEVRLRDRNDSERAAAPLRQAEDAWLCDSSQLSFEQTVVCIINYIRERMAI